MLQETQAATVPQGISDQETVQMQQAGRYLHARSDAMDELDRAAPSSDTRVAFFTRATCRPGSSAVRTAVCAQQRLDMEERRFK
jgi:hypothetical protein